jgi:exodeoxyribonuclease V alpha subunit
MSNCTTHVQLLQREGVSQQTAEKVVDHFGEDLFQILRQEPKRLEEIPRLRQGTREKILKAAKRFVDEKVAIIALNVGVATERAFEIAAEWDWRTVQKRPYCLIRDLSFGTTDKIARKILGDTFEEFGEERTLAAIICQLKKAANDGNCGAPVEKIVAYLRRNYAFSQLVVNAANNRGIELGELVRDRWRGKDVLFDEVKYRSEARLFDEICEHQSLDRESGYCREEAFKEIRSASPIVLTPEQEAAIYNALHEPISIITGGPGTGKTTIIKTLAALVAGTCRVPYSGSSRC